MREPSCLRGWGRLQEAAFPRFSKRRLVDLDAEAGLLRNPVVRALQHRTPHEDVGYIALQPLARCLATFEPGEVGHRRRELHACREADRAEGIVRHHVDVVSLAQPPATFIASVRPPTLQTSTRAYWVRAARDEREEQPFRGEFLAHREGDPSHAAQRRVGFRILGADRLFQEIQRAVGETLAEGADLADAETMVQFHTEADARTERAAHFDQPGRHLHHPVPRLEGHIALGHVALGHVGRQQANALPALRLHLQGEFDSLRGGGGADRGESRHEVATLAAEQMVHRDAELLALDVQQRDVDGGDRRAQDAAAFEILAAVHILPQMVGLQRILPDQEVAEMVDRALNGAQPADQSGLAPAEDPVIPP